MITGNDLIAKGHKPGPWFKDALNHINWNGLEGAELDMYLESVKPAPIQTIPLHDEPAPCVFNIEAETDAERSNVEAVRETMRQLLRTPTAVQGVVMPDACPAGPMGSIPVGGVVAARNAIHPGWHSADACCSVMATFLGNVPPDAVLDKMQRVTHFGGGGRPADDRFRPVSFAAPQNNKYLSGAGMHEALDHHLGTQGDGNHFAFVGVSKNTGATCLVTHHGSRKPGALLYKRGMKDAVAHTQKIAPDVSKFNSWLDADSDDGQQYWAALQYMRQWTKLNHSVLHDAVATYCLGYAGRAAKRHWNEHNFVFKDGDIYWHAKGATPLLDKFLPDTTGLQLIPLNSKMVAPLGVEPRTSGF